MRRILPRITLFAFLFLMVFNASAQGEFIYAEDKPIEGQLHTAKLLQKAMAEKDYDTAITLFSKKQQVTINNNRKEKNANFDFWCKGWALEGEMFEYYTKKINKGKANFVFEDGAWKIDEN